MNIKKRINRYSTGETPNFSTDAPHLSKLGSQSAYVLMGETANMLSSVGLPPPIFILGIINVG